MELIGWIGSAMLALCALPQAWKSYRTKSSADLSGWFLGLWCGGEVLLLIYVVPKGDIPLIANYTVNLALLAVIIKYKWWAK